MPRSAAAATTAASSSSTSGVKGGKAGKSTGMPKKVTTAYFAFTATKREEVKKLNPDKKVTELAKIFGSMWRELSDQEKEPYLQMVEKDKKRYEKEMALYNQGKFVPN